MKTLFIFWKRLIYAYHEFLFSWNEFFLLFRGFEIHFAATNLFRGKERKKKYFLSATVQNL